MDRCNTAILSNSKFVFFFQKKKTFSALRLHSGFNPYFWRSWRLQWDLFLRQCVSLAMLHGTNHFRKLNAWFHKKSFRVLWLNSRWIIGPISCLKVQDTKAYLSLIFLIQNISFRRRIFAGLVYRDCIFIKFRKHFVTFNVAKRRRAFLAL